MYCRLFNKETSPPQNSSSSSCPIIIIIAATVVLIFRKQLLAFFFHNGKKLIQNCERIAGESRSLVFGLAKHWVEAQQSKKVHRARAAAIVYAGVKQAPDTHQYFPYYIIEQCTQSQLPAEMQAAHAPKAEMKWWKYRQSSNGTE